MLENTHHALVQVQQGNNLFSKILLKSLLLKLNAEGWYFCTNLYACFSFSEIISPGSYGSTPHVLPSFEHPSHALLKENGFTQVGYHKYHERCLKGLWFSFFLNLNLGL